MNKVKLITVFIAILCSFHLMSQSFYVPEIKPLTVIPEQTSGASNAVISLNGTWDFNIAPLTEQMSNPTGDWKKIQVPGEWEMQGFKVNEGEKAIYKKTLDISETWRGKKIIIRFDAASSHAIVKINGKMVAEHEGSFVPFEADLTSHLTFSNDVLSVEVQALTISDRLACTSQYACHTVGGLLRKVTLFVVPQTNITSVTTNTIFDIKYENATLQLNALLAGTLPGLSLRYSLLDATGNKVIEKTVSAKINTTTDLLIKQANQWNAEQPYLYTLKTELLLNKKPLQIIVQKIGLREIKITGNKFLVNGKSVKLHGVNRHSVYPLTGRSVYPELDRKDAELFRNANCNYIRTSHYPPSEEFLNACDELGLFVESEASLCWIEHGASPIWKLWNYLDEKYLPFMIRANIDNVLAGRSHPCVIIWSLGNESRWSPLWDKVIGVVKQLDPTRPTCFHDQCWWGFNNAGSKADIANYHYPDINTSPAWDTMNRPVLFGEYAHLTTYNRRELLTDPGVRSAYNAPLVKFYDTIYAHKGILGAAIWSGIDDIFHMPDGRIVGYGPWGPLDAWRRPKPEYYGMKKAYSPIRITKVNWSIIENGYVELQIENRYDFTSLKDVKIDVKLNGIAQTLTSSIPPRSDGKLKIPVNKSTYEIYISFADPRGFIADEEKFRNNAEVAYIEHAPVSFSENDHSITVKQGDVSWLISKSTGIITKAEKKGQRLLQQGPVFCVVPMNNENGGKPNVAGETYQNNIYPLKNYSLYTLFAKSIDIKQNSEGVHIVIDVTYTNAKGKQWYKFDNNGELTVDYEVKYNGNDTIPYQYGLLMQLPKDFDKVSWKRKGEFSIYPEYDIARNEGTASLNARQINGVEEWGVIPQGDWKDDANEFGSNDFRSTKRFIKTASLMNKNRESISVVSDGTQFSRSWLQDERIQWLIADYSNNGSEPFYGSPHTDGRINIRNKTLKGKLVLTIK